MKILLTGGLGYIGSHTAVELLNHHHEVIIVDNLANSSLSVLDRLKKITHQEIPFYQIDVANKVELEPVFLHHTFDAIIHFAGLKAVGESVAKPLEYYQNNVLATLNLASFSIKYGVHKFVFSSSATVYGDQPSPLIETMELKTTTNPYGETKAMSERILTDAAKANPPFSVSLLRYFNPIGAHESALIGENPNGIPNNLMPYITKVAKGELKELQIYGQDYPTIDGTGIRDYIHVVDLAKGHIAALNKMKSAVNIYNLGTGKGVSVLELVTAFQNVNHVRVPYKVVGRRPGDLAIVYADPGKAKRELGWETSKTIEDMCRDAWNFEKQNVRKHTDR
ncbi:MAG: UDP-glucose 4-epimerase GalE [Candidatus Izemoplasmatales bacterium]|nr:UDP-glucose 4-epimerase GalE [Candidatus Izemoplasmatales bacterium]